jgi:hypothetical protein
MAPAEPSDLILADLASRFIYVAEHELGDASPLYVTLCRTIAADHDLLALAAQATHTPVTKLFLDAVHYLLLRDLSEPLAAYYPDLTAQPNCGDPVPAFRAFCQTRREAIIALLQTKLVQTNEVSRCALWLPAFTWVSRQHPDQPLSLIEIGASAGLNLLWDRYGYDFGTGRVYGQVESRVQLHCALRGNRLPPLPDALPAVVMRVGLDLHPLDVGDPDDRLWLRALIIPEQHDRVALLERAAALLVADPPALWAGDALETLPAALAATPADAVVCVYHSFTLQQFADESRDRLSSLLTEAARERALCQLSIEGYRREDPYASLRITDYTEPVPVEQVYASCQLHGRWLEWLA